MICGKKGGTELTWGASGTRKPSMSHDGFVVGSVSAKHGERGGKYVCVREGVLEYVCACVRAHLLE